MGLFARPANFLTFLVHDEDPFITPVEKTHDKRENQLFPQKVAWHSFPTAEKFFNQVNFWHLYITPFLGVRLPTAMQSEISFF